MDIDKHCLLVWGPSGWDVLADHYKHVKKDAAQEHAVRERKCPKATPKVVGSTAKLVGPALGGEAVIAIKTPDCKPTEWP